MNTREKLLDIREKLECVHDSNVEGARLAREAVDSLPRREDAPILGSIGKYGVEVDQCLILEASSLVGGAYLIPPASMPHLAGDVIRADRRRISMTDGFATKQLLKN